MQRITAVNPAEATGKAKQLLDAVQAKFHSIDAKRDAGPHFVQALVVQRGMVSDQELTQVKAAGYTDGDIAELVANVAVNIFTNYFNHVARTDVDFSHVDVHLATLAHH